MVTARRDGIVLRGILLGDEKPSDVVLRNGTVASIRPAGRGEADVGSRTAYIGPTLFDIQVNGANGINLQGDKVKPEDVRDLTDFLAGHGISHFVPTLGTNEPHKMEHGCRMLAEALQDKTVARAVPGIHFEGPHLSPMDGPRGGHARALIRKPSLRELDRLLKAFGGRVLYVTLAPEVSGAIPFVRGLVKRGIVPALGHHHGSADDIARAVDAGARLCTHLGNGLAPVLNRHLNPLWPQLACDTLYASFIADLEHLPPPVLKSFVRAKGLDKTILTSDCVKLAGMKPGRYPHQNGFKGMFVEIEPSGRTRVCGTELLAGSTMMLFQAAINAACVTDLTLAQAFTCATVTPAKALGVKRDLGRVRVGRKADLIVFDVSKSRPWKGRIKAVFVNGERKA